jgi:hypothetical protein
MSARSAKESGIAVQAVHCCFAVHWYPGSRILLLVIQFIQLILVVQFIQCRGKSLSKINKYQ